MKKNILSRFSLVEKYGVRTHVVILYEVYGNFFVTWKYTSMKKFDSRSFGIDENSARFNYTQKVLFLLS